MKKKRIMLTAWALTLALLCGCESGLSGLVQKLYPAKDEAVVAQQQAAEEKKTSKPQETTEVVTKTYSAIESFGLAYQPEYGLHPYDCESMNNRVILSFLYEPLFAVTDTFEAVPILASDYETGEGGSVTTVHLRSGITFHNGQSFTAEDAVYSIQASMNSKYYGTRPRFVSGVEAVDDTTVVITASQSYECLPMLLDMPMIPADSAEAAIPSGTGPYRYVSAQKLVKWENWWQEGPALVDFDEIAMTVANSAADTRDQFEYQNVNLVLTDPNSTAFAGFHNDNELWTQTTTILQYLGYNMNSEIFSNYGLRGAITYAIDRTYLAEDVLGGFAVETTLPCTPGSCFYDTKLADTYSYSLSKFRAQLESASIEDADEDGILDVYVPSKGYSLPVAGTMIVCSANYLRVQAANEVADMLNELGFDITVESMEYSEYKHALLTGDFDLYYGEVRLSPNFDLSPFFGASGTLNYGSLSNSTMMNLCSMAMTNSGNSYNLYKRVCERGYLTPLVMKTHALYSTRGAVHEPTNFIDWVLPEQAVEGVTQRPETIPAAAEEAAEAVEVPAEEVPDEPLEEPAEGSAEA